MGTLIPELECTLDRILIIAPNEKKLLSAFEEMSMALLDPAFSGEQVLNYKTTRLSEGPFKIMTSFILGQRAKLDVRISCLGLTFDDLEKNPGVLEVNDIFIVVWDSEGRLSDKFIRKITEQSRLSRPVIISGLDVATIPPDRLDLKAQVAWIKRSLPRHFFLNKPAEWLAPGLEWILSF
jgi:hypothetical protein